jgi:hypothetical protein
MQGVEVEHHTFLALALEGGESSASCPNRFTPWVRALGTHWTGGWVDLRAHILKILIQILLTLSLQKPKIRKEGIREGQN